MGIEIPGYLQWVSYLVGSEWPDGDEDGMWRIAEHWRHSSTELTALIPDLNNIRAQTMAVLVGETAAAADDQFKMLLDGEYSVDKLAQAMAAVGELSDKTGTSIQYAKISILVSLSKAAAEIMYAYATASETWGASLEMIPVTEAFTRYSIRQAVMNLLKQIFGQLDEALKKTLVKELLREGIEKLEWAAAKELTVEGIQMANGHRNGLDWSKFAKGMSVAFIGGAVNQSTKDFLKDVLKWLTQRVVTEEGALGFREVDDPIEGAIKGALTGYAGGTSASVAGTLVSGGTLDPATVFTSGIASAVKGGVQGAVKANNVERYDRGWYPAGKQGSNPFTKPVGWNNRLVTGGLVSSSSAALGAAWGSGHTSGGQSGANSPAPATPGGDAAQGPGSQRDTPRAERGLPASGGGPVPAESVGPHNATPTPVAHELSTIAVPETQTAWANSVQPAAAAPVGAIFALAHPLTSAETATAVSPSASTAAPTGTPDAAPPPSSSAIRRVDGELSQLTALVKPAGPLALGDEDVHFAAGSRWPHELAELCTYAERMVAAGYDDFQVMKAGWWLGESTSHQHRQ